VLTWIDRAAGAAFVLFAAGHGFLGTLAARPFMDPGTVWAFSASIAAWMIAATHLTRSFRGGDRALAWITLAGAAAWLATMAWLAEAAGMWADARIWLWFGASALIVAFNARAAFAPAR
jgi:hypothetical protein